MDLFKRHPRLTVMVTVLFVQVMALAYQVKRPTERGPVRLIRLWGINLIAPAEHGVVDAQDWIHDTWRNYFYLRDVRRENERLEDENARLRMEQVRLMEDASQAQRLQALLKFKEQFVSQTVAAQVIGSSGSEQSRILYLDKGANDGIRTDMAVIVPGGVVGKIIRVLPNTSQVLEINDQFSGVGAILEKSRLQGILKGTPAGQTMVHYVMTDEKVEAGEMVLTSGGDRIFPKGLPIGRVTQVEPGADSFLNIWVAPSARLSHVEEVLVITKVEEKQRDEIPEAPMRAADILAQRLPKVPLKPPEPTPAAQPEAGQPASGATATGVKTGTAVIGTAPKPGTVTGPTAKPGTTTPAAPNAGTTATKPPAPATTNAATKPPATNATMGSSSVPTAVKPNGQPGPIAKTNGTTASKIGSSNPSAAPKAPAVLGGTSQTAPAGTKVGGSGATNAKPPATKPKPTTTPDNGNPQ